MQRTRDMTYLVIPSRLIVEHQSEQARLKVILLIFVTPIDEFLELLRVVNDVINEPFVRIAIFVLNGNHSKRRAALVNPVSFACFLVEDALQMSHELSGLWLEFI
jgi:hypothetical protein